MFRRIVQWRSLPCLLGLLLVSTSGCATLDALQGIPAIPANRLPREFLGEKRSDMQQISMARLRQDPPEVYQLGANDILGVYIEGILPPFGIGPNGETIVPPPQVHHYEDGALPPAIGIPVPVREDGTIVLPSIPPLQVAGLTLTQATSLIRKAYIEDRPILKPGQDSVIVTLMKRRTVRVLVVREEEGTNEQGVTKRGTGFTVDLPAYENDLLHALNETGGLPGLDARNEILIYRGGFADGVERDQLVAQINSGGDPCICPPPLPDDPNVVRVPIRFHSYDQPTFTEEDIILSDGDIVMINARDRDKFYTGGLLGGGEHYLPRDYDLDVLGAIALAGGPVGTGSIGLGGRGGSGGGFGGGGRGGGAGGGIPPSKVIILRKTCNGGQIPIRVSLHKALADPRQRILIQPEDVVILQYTFDEELINAALGLVQFNFLFNGFSGNGVND